PDRPERLAQSHIGRDCKFSGRTQNQVHWEASHVSQRAQRRWCNFFSCDELVGPLGAYERGPWNGRPHPTKGDYQKANELSNLLRVWSHSVASFLLSPGSRFGRSWETG